MTDYSAIVVGAGAGGLVVAIGASKAGKKTLLIERGTYGGDCTNFGCIPSKSLIASAHAAYALKEGKKLGLEGASPFKEATKALERVRSIITEVRSHEDSKALAEKGVETLTGTARFVDAHTLEVTELSGEKRQISGKQIVLATGSSPFIPPAEGLKETPFLTNETVFDLESIPESLCVMGGGPIGCELAQAFSRLGSKVILVHSHEALLNKEEREAQEVIAKQFREEGLSLCLGYRAQKVSYDGRTFHIQLKEKNSGKVESVSAHSLLIATGRRPNVAALNLDAAGVTHSERGIPIDKYGRTNQKHIWAVGDVVGGPLFTHLAENQARTVLTSLLLPFKKRLDRQPIPRVTYTDPEVASVGLTEEKAKEIYHPSSIVTYTVPMQEVDRALTAGRTEGYLRFVTKKWSSRILGATIVGPRAGEMLPQISTAIVGKIPLRKLARVIHPYPTYSLGIRRAGDLWLTQTFLPGIKNLPKTLPWKRFLPLFVILALMVFAYALGLDDYLTFELLKEKHTQLTGFVAAHPFLTPLLFITFYMILTALSLPLGALLSLLGGFLFPIPWSTLYVLIGATLGATAIFFAARTAIGDFLRKKAGPTLKKMETGFRENAWSYLLFLRFIPLFPFWLVNIAPAFFGVSLFTFIWTTFVGIIPGAYVYTQTGAGLGAIFETGSSFTFDAIFNIQIRIGLIALALFCLLPVFIKRYLKKRRNTNLRK